MLEGVFLPIDSALLLLGQVPCSVLTHHVPSFCRQRLREEIHLPREGLSCQGVLCWALQKHRLRGNFSYSLSAPKVKEFSFGFILPERGKKELIWSLPDALPEPRLSVPFPVAFCSLPAVPEDKEKGNFDSIGTAIAQFTTRSQGSLEGEILPMWGNR